MNNKHFFAAVGLVLSFTAQAQAPANASADDHSAHHSAAPAASTPAASVMVDGEVRKVDREQGKLTLRHGPIPNLEMPGMTMVFRVTNPQMLDEVKQGDQVRFAAERVNGAFIVTALEPAPK